ncbi:MAG: T9SS type A sorting domain-containing protein [Candidatus Eisenbacteria sp.]|nr:T9SS type A sorting domain-containing protein [Candidatus Eisenbacteria bacterium]
MSHCKRCLPLLVVAICSALVCSWVSDTRAANLEFTTDNPVDITQVNWFVELEAVLTNTGAQGDRFDILRTIIYRPDNWFTPICVEGGCQQDNVDSLQVLLGAGNSTTIGINFDTVADEGGAVVQLMARSVLDPSKKKTITLVVVTDGIEVLIVDDDGGQEYQDYLSAAFQGSRTWGVWPRELEPVLSADLLTFPVVAWMTGEATPALSAADRLAIGAFLDDGGRLFLTGQDIGYGMCDAASPDYSVETKAFYEDRFGATYVADDSGILDITGVGGDPISDGMSFSISGGDGAGNQTAPSEIAANGDGSSVIFNYLSRSGPAGVKVDKDGYRLAYLAFGFEGISTPADRTDLAAAIYDWLVAVGNVEGEFPVVRGLTGLRCYPNPFNPTVTISFAIPGAGDVRVDIFDICGRRVVSIPVEASLGSPVSVEWNGLDHCGRAVAGGVYTCRVTLDENQALTAKLVLLK